MSESKLSRFIKKRYFIAPEGSDSVLAKNEAVAVDVVAGEKGEAGSKEKSLVEEKSEPAPLEKVEEKDPVLATYEKSNSGRTYGWWVYLDGHRVASMEYRCRLDDLVHLYSVNVLDDKFLRIDLDAEKWMNSNVTFQSRYAGSFIKQGLSMAAVGNKMIVAEGLSIPEDHFRKQYLELKEFHEKLLEAAQSKSKGDS